MTNISSLFTERLVLVSMSPEFLQASHAKDAAKAAQLLGFAVPAEWLEESWLIDLRLSDLRTHSDWQPWLLRATVLRSSGAMIGYVGFHTPPNPEYLQPYAPGGVEIGYTIFPKFRKHGYAREACAGMMEWAAREHGVPRFVLSINPDNTPSVRIAIHFGFTKVATLDEEDGPEDVYVREA